MIVTVQEFIRVAARVRQEDPWACIVFTNGCFANLHIGHLHLLSYAGRFPNSHLFVAINGDDYLRQKHPGHQMQTALMRAMILDTTVRPTAICVFQSPSPSWLLDDLKPDVYLQGDEYQPFSHPSVKQVVFVPRLPGYSTSETLKAKT